jgi:hypothetical protein
MGASWLRWIHSFTGYSAQNCSVIVQCSESGDFRLIGEIWNPESAEESRKVISFCQPVALLAVDATRA